MVGGKGGGGGGVREGRKEGEWRRVGKEIVSISA